jgi:hypothetical protein
MTVAEFLTELTELTEFFKQENMKTEKQEKNFFRKKEGNGIWNEGMSFPFMISCFPV